MQRYSEAQTAEQQNVRGEECFSKGAYQDALAAFETALRIDPNSAITFNNKGTVLWQMGRRGEALRAFYKAWSLKPSDRLIVLNIADVLRAMGKQGDLIHVLEGYVKEHPDDVDLVRRLEKAKTQWRLPAIETTAEAVSRNMRYGAKTMQNGNRLAVVIDFATQPYCMGDLIVYQAAAEALRALKGLERVDICIVSDPKIAPADENIRALVSAENRYYHLMQYLPVLQLNPCLGSVLIFDSLGSARQHIENSGTYHTVWPKVEELEERRYLYYEAVSLLKAHHDAYHRMPALSFCWDLKQWYRQFVRQWVGTNVAVTVNLRNNGNFHDHRNSMMEQWQRLFAYCRERYPATFILTSSAEEVDPRFRACPNVIIAKDHQTTMMQDLALIRFSAFHMGASSGPAAIPMLSEKPYLIANCDMQPHLQLYEGAVIQASSRFLRFSFASDLQKFSIGRESAEFLIREFNKMYDAVTKAPIN